MRGLDPPNPSNRENRAELGWLAVAVATLPARVRFPRCRRGFDSQESHPRLSLGVPPINLSASHAWSHKGIATHPSSTESSGDLKKDAFFVSECSCRAVCTRIVV